MRVLKTARGDYPRCHHPGPRRLAARGSGRLRSRTGGGHIGGIGVSAGAHSLRALAAQAICGHASPPRWQAANPQRRLSEKLISQIPPSPETGANHPATMASVQGASDLA